MQGVIVNFKGRYRFLSNFYPTKVGMSGIEYPTVEHAYQAAKTDNRVLRIAIAATATPGKAKRLGRKVPLRPGWDTIKEAIMRELLWQKFQDPQLAKKLLATAPAVLVEGNYWHDSWWGVCYCQHCDGYGLNILGRMLMALRDNLET